MKRVLLGLIVLSLMACSGRDGGGGPAGRDGIPGQDGHNGSDGRDGSDGVDGADGAPGADGQDGAPGADGQDGAPGVDGRDGVDAAPSVVTIPLCPSIVDTHGVAQTLLWIDGTLYSVTYVGAFAKLALVVPGSYVTTDGRACHFTVGADLSVSS